MGNERTLGKNSDMVRMISLVIRRLRNYSMINLTDVKEPTHMTAPAPLNDRSTRTTTSMVQTALNVYFVTKSRKRCGTDKVSTRSEPRFQHLPSALSSP